VGCSLFGTSLPVALCTIIIHLNQNFVQFMKRMCGIEYIGLLHMFWGNRKHQDRNSRMSSIRLLFNHLVWVENFSLVFLLVYIFTFVYIELRTSSVFMLPLRLTLETLGNQIAWQEHQTCVIYQSTSIEISTPF
jgi:hypothetical protein